MSAHGAEPASIVLEPSGVYGPGGEEIWAAPGSPPLDGPLLLPAPAHQAPAAGPPRHVAIEYEVTVAEEPAPAGNAWASAPRATEFVVDAPTGSERPATAARRSWAAGVLGEAALGTRRRGAALVDSARNRVGAYTPPAVQYGAAVIMQTMLDVARDGVARLPLSDRTRQPLARTYSRMHTSLAATAEYHRAAGEPVVAAIAAETELGVRSARRFVTGLRDAAGEGIAAARHDMQHEQRLGHVAMNLIFEGRRRQAFREAAAHAGQLAVAALGPIGRHLDASIMALHDHITTSSNWEPARNSASDAARRLGEGIDRLAGGAQTWGVVARDWGRDRVSRVRASIGAARGHAARPTNRPDGSTPPEN